MSNQQDSKSNKDKLRVHEYAKGLSMSSKEIITILKRLDLPVTNHMSVMEKGMITKVEGFFREIKENAAVKRSNEESSQSAAKVKPVVSVEKKEISQEKRQGTTNSINTNDTEKREQQPLASRSNDSSQSNTQRPEGQNREVNKDGQRPTSTQSGQSRERSSYDSNRPQGTRPQGDRPQGTRPQGDRPQGTRPQGDRPQGTRPQGDRPQGTRPQGDRPQGTRPQGDRPQGTRPQGDRPQGTRPQGDRPQGTRPQGDRPQGTRPQGDRPQGTRPQGDRPQGDRPQGTRPQGDRPQGSRPQGSGQGGSRPPFNKDRQSTPSTASSAPVTKPTENRYGTKVEDRNFSKGKHSNKRFEDGKPNFNGRNNNRGRNQKGRYSNQPPKEKIDNTPKKIIVRGEMTVGELAKLLHKDASEVIKKLLFLGTMATINQEVDLDTILLIAAEYGVEVEVKIPVEEDNFETVEEVDEVETLETRPPVVTIMGHVDHGKTTLLDAIRKTSVTTGEAGGITQHIGAYQVEINGKKITFLDTPGHEAFTLMRARGAQVTDITIIVVAADDGIMPQTVEAIAHAKAANCPIIVAVNKIDKPDANVEKIKQEMTEYELVPEEWGGDTIFVEVSAKQRINLEGLLEMILLVSEVNEYTANPNKRARGTVIEAELDKGKGPVARILVQHGTLKVGDAFVAGHCFGRVRAMVNDRGRRIKEAGPSTPIEITGLTEVPLAGDPFIVFEDERKARAIADRRAIKQRQSSIGEQTRVTLDNLMSHIKDGEMKELNVIIKADVQGSAEALKGSLAKIDVEGVRVKIIHSGAGAITESDIILASASNAIVIGFNVRPDPQAEATIGQEKVDVRMHNIIYNIIDEIELAMKGLLDPIYKETIIGHAEVRNIFKVTKVGSIAGSMVIDGKITRNAEARVIRDNVVVYTGKVDTLKRFKDDAKDVTQGFECGITLERFNDVKVGDIVEAFIMETVER